MAPENPSTFSLVPTSAPSSGLSRDKRLPEINQSISVLVTKMASTVETGTQVDNDSGELSLRQALGSGSAVDEKTGTSDDRANMFRMGKKQELRVCNSDGISVSPCR